MTFIPGDTVTIKDNRIDVGIKIRSTPWIAVDEVRVIINWKGKPNKSTEITV